MKIKVILVGVKRLMFIISELGVIILCYEGGGRVNFNNCGSLLKMNFSVAHSVI